MLCTKSDFNPPMWVNICRTWGRPQSRTGSEAQRSDRVRIERHKPAEATYAAIECYSTWTQSFRCASLPVLLSLTHIGAYKQFLCKALVSSEPTLQNTAQELAIWKLRCHRHSDGQPNAGRRPKLLLLQQA